jgi:hypothetical protein
LSDLCCSYSAMFDSYQETPWSLWQEGCLLNWATYNMNENGLNKPKACTHLKYLQYASMRTMTSTYMLCANLLACLAWFKLQDCLGSLCRFFLQHNFSCKATEKISGEILIPICPQQFYLVCHCPLMTLYVLNY